MSIAIVFASCFILLITGYFLYGSFITKLFKIDDKTSTPAHVYKDGKEYIPTHPFYLFCQHFSAIAASGPIAGPILACQKWGWLPALFWICLGVVLIGAVHDFGILTASVRQKGSSIVEIAKAQLGERGAFLILIFIWIALVYIIISFIQVTAATFVSSSEELQSVANINFNPGGAVCAAALFYLFLCLIFGLSTKFFNPPLWLSTLIFVPATFIAIYLGTQYSNLFIFNQKTFEISILFYCAIASLLPIWLLVQPRGYLGGFILIIVLFVGILGIFFGNHYIKQPLYKNSTESFSQLYPFLFVTIACGACSGFHALVCGGTTAKQIANENHLQPVGYGAMLAEGLVALIALSTIMIFSVDETAQLKPGTIYGKGIGEYLTQILGEKWRLFATTFGAMAFSTFVFDTLDIATRIGRYLLQELFGFKKASHKYFAVGLTLMGPFGVILSAKEDSWMQYWTLFGSANQLLAAFSLLILSLYLKSKRRNFLVTLVPMCFVLCTTLLSMIQIAITNLTKYPMQIADTANGIIAIVLIVIALGVLLEGMKATKKTVFEQGKEKLELG